MPASIRREGGERLVLARRLVSCTLLLGPWGPLFGMMFAVLGYQGPALAVIVGWVLFMATPAMLALTRDPRIAALWATLQVYWVVVLVALSTGGTSSPSVAFLAALPLFGSVLQGRRLAPWMAVLAVATVVALFLVGPAVTPPSSGVRDVHARVFPFVASGTLVVIVYSLAVFHQTLAERALAALSASNQALEATANRDRRARQELEELNARVAEQARVVGRAEIGHTILHDMGNALNHVNLLATEASKSAREMRIHRLAQVVGLIEDHRDDLARWLSRDHQGVLINDYLSQLAQRLGDERDALVRQLDQVLSGIEELRSVVRTQNVHPRRTLLPEAVDVAEVVEQAVRLTRWSADDIEVERRVRRLRPVVIDRQRLLEILVHLLANARHAVLEADVDVRRIRVEVWSAPDGRLRLTVSDNGAGIAAEDLDRVFQHGFTTREHGVGFGLHACALSAREMGGSLTASSPGPGRGATFTLDLPQHSPDPPRSGDQGHGNTPPVTPLPENDNG